MYLYRSTLCLLTVLFGLIGGAKILSVFPSCGYSQFILGERLIQELTARGHEVTVISLFEPKDPQNYTTIHLKDVLETFKQEPASKELEEPHIISDILYTFNLGYQLTERILQHKKVQDLLESDAEFDLVLVEQFFNEAHMGFAKHFDAHLVLFSSIGLSEWNHHLTGNIHLPSLYPVSFLPFHNTMDFSQRIENFITKLFIRGYQELVAYPQQQTYLTKYFPNKFDLSNIMYNASLLLLNSDVTIGEAYDSNHATIDIGSFHIVQNKLPDNLQTFLDDAENGAIYFSLGTNLKSSDLNKEEIRKILEVFGGLKQRVLWKFEALGSVEVPNNVLVTDWLPQVDILAHPNTALFITHGGLLSTTEAVFFGVPMIGVPVYGDQRMNVARSVAQGHTVHIPLSKFSAESLKAAIKEVLENDKYSENAWKRSNMLREKPVRPIDNAMFWIQYVLNHDGAPHLRSRTMDLSWRQIYLLDVVFLLTVFIWFVIVILSIIVYKLYSYLIANVRFESKTFVPKPNSKKKLKKYKKK